VSVGDLQSGEVKRLTLDGKVGGGQRSGAAEMTLILRAGAALGQLPSAKKVSRRDETRLCAGGHVCAGRCRSAAEAEPISSSSRRRWALPSAWGSSVRAALPGQVCGTRCGGDGHLFEIDRRNSSGARTDLLDGHAAEEHLAEVLEEWLPKQADPATVVYVSVTGRGVVDPTTGAVSIMLFDSTAASGARLYSIRRLEESLAKLPIQRALVMLDLSLELASGIETSVTITPVWEQEGGGKTRSCG